MRFTHLRQIAFAAILAFAVALLGLAAQPASADTPDVAFTVDQPAVTPGSTVNVTMTLTNNQATDIGFVYQSIQPTWATSQRGDLKYTFTSCTSEGASCTGTGTTGLEVRYTLPWPPAPAVPSRSRSRSRPTPAATAPSPSTRTSTTSTTDTRAPRTASTTPRPPR